MFEYERIYGELIADLPGNLPNSSDDPTGMRDSVERVSSTHRKVEKLSSAISTRVLNFLNSYEDSMSKYQYVCFLQQRVLPRETVQGSAG